LHSFLLPGVQDPYNQCLLQYKAVQKRTSSAAQSIFAETETGQYTACSRTEKAAPVAQVEAGWLVGGQTIGWVEAGQSKRLSQWQRLEQQQQQQQQ
jgi:hypothetical protein